MSGIAGIVNLNGAPVAYPLLAHMLETLTFRGPDAQHIWIDGASGFVHALLKTTNESEQEHQPFTLDGKVWIVADARVDARYELISKLKTDGQEVAGDVPDVELILRAYHVWGESCVEHLLGDFAFGIWDRSQNRLFCARDHLGVKPFYYAHIGQCVIFSNTLDCVRQHPSVSDRLNDLAVADFLLFDLNQDKATTTFADIQRVPPAHCATWSEGGMQLRHYWTLPIDEPVYYRRQEDYVDRFKELLQTAVGDRLRTNRVGIFMSGGLDSPTLASTARDLLRTRSGNVGVCAFTTSYDGYDEEGYYAGLVARSLGISIEIRGWNAETADPRWCQTRFHTPEPVPYPNCLAAGWDRNQRVAAYSRVALFGEGPDNALLHEWRAYFSYLLRRRRFGRLLYDLAWLGILHWRLPVPTIPRILKPRPCQASQEFFPDWFNEDFERHLGLRARWDQVLAEPHRAHPVRPVAHGSFGHPLWQSLLLGCDAEHTRSLLEVRHPFLDLRFLRYLLAVPVTPWCRAKYVLRRAMRGRLPEPVLRRPKSPLVRDLWVERVMEDGLPPLVAAPGLDRYVNIDRVRTCSGGPDRFWIDFRTRSFNYWLQNLHVSAPIYPITTDTQEDFDELAREAANGNFRIQEKGIQPPSVAGLWKPARGHRQHLHQEGR